VHRYGIQDGLDGHSSALLGTAEVVLIGAVARLIYAK
jgi:hypothetical protein